MSKLRQEDPIDYPEMALEGPWWVEGEEFDITIAWEAFTDKWVYTLMIMQGIERGEFRPVDPVDTANALLALEEGLANLLAADPQGTRWRESFLLGCQLMIAGLRHTEAR